MQELLVISNPRRRKGGRKSKARRRSKSRRASPAQIAARKRFAAMARAGSFKRRRRGARRSQSSNGVAIMAKRRSRRRRNPAARAGRRLSFGAVTRQPMRFLTPALWGAVGAIAVNTVMSRVVPMVLPANLQAMFMVGRARYLTQGLAAIALGMAAQRFGVRAGLAERMAEGSLTVTMTDALRDLTMSMGVPLGGVGYYLPGRNPGAAVPSAGGRPASQLNGMNAYVTGPGATSQVIPMRRNMAGMGFGPGRTF